jgi:DNA-binding XRE family transcriptional regulator
MPSKKIGRPVEMTEEKVKKAEQGIALGMSFEQAAHLIGVDRATFMNWRKNDKIFFDRINMARAMGVCRVAGHLMAQIEDGNAASTIFWLKTRGGTAWRDEARDPDDEDGVKQVRFTLEIKRPRMAQKPMTKAEKNKLGIVEDES